MKSGLATVEKQLKQRMDGLVDLQKKDFLDGELKHVEHLTRNDEKQENVEEVA